MQRRMSTRTGWAMTLTALSAAGLFAAWQSGDVPRALGSGCDPRAVGWSYDVAPTADGATRVVGMRFDDVPPGCVGTAARVQFRHDGAVVDSYVVALGRQDVVTGATVDGAEWAPVG